MTMLRDVRLIPHEHDEVPAASAPAEAYWMLSGGVYVLGTGDKAHEAVAFEEDLGGGVFRLNDSIAEEDHIMYLVAGSANVVLT